MRKARRGRTEPCARSPARTLARAYARQCARSPVRMRAHAVRVRAPRDETASRGRGRIKGARRQRRRKTEWASGKRGGGSDAPSGGRKPARLGSAPALARAFWRGRTAKSPSVRPCSARHRTHALPATLPRIATPRFRLVTALCLLASCLHAPCLPAPCLFAPYLPAPCLPTRRFPASRPRLAAASPACPAPRPRLAPSRPLRSPLSRSALAAPLHCSRPRFPLPLLPPSLPPPLPSRPLRPRHPMHRQSSRRDPHDALRLGAAPTETRCDSPPARHAGSLPPLPSPLPPRLARRPSASAAFSNAPHPVETPQRAGLPLSRIAVARNRTHRATPLALVRKPTWAPPEPTRPRMRARGRARGAHPGGRGKRGGRAGNPWHETGAARTRPNRAGAGMRAQPREGTAGRVGRSADSRASSVTAPSPVAPTAPCSTPPSPPGVVSAPRGNGLSTTLRALPAPDRDPDRERRPPTAKRSEKNSSKI